MNSINNLIEFSPESIKKLKIEFKKILNERNVVFNNSQINELYSFIDNGIIEVSDDGEFTSNDELIYIYTSDVIIYQDGKKDPLSNATKNKIKKIPNAYNIKYLNGFKRYILNFNKLFLISTKNQYIYCRSLFSLELDDLIEIASHSFSHYLNNIYLLQDGKRIRKIVIGDDGTQIYKIDFGEYGVYIGQSKNVKKRMNGHKSQARSRNHCYVLNKLYETNPDYFCQCLLNYKILEKPKIVDYAKNGYTSTSFEYDCQIKSLKNGEKLLGKQCWDIDFRKYLANHVDEYEYQELLLKSFEINNNPKIHNGYSTYNPCSKTFHNKTMSYEDVEKYFNSLKQKYIKKEAV